MISSSFMMVTDIATVDAIRRSVHHERDLQTASQLWIDLRPIKVHFKLPNWTFNQLIWLLATWRQQDRHLALAFSRSHPQFESLSEIRVKEVSHEIEPGGPQIKDEASSIERFAR
jgi:hypothetical protein